MKLLVLVFALSVGMVCSAPSKTIFEDQRLFQKVFKKEPFATKKPCCLPKTYEAYMNEGIAFENEKQSVKGMMSVTGMIAIDSNKQKAAGDLLVAQNNSSNEMIFIIDYKQHVMHLAYPASKTCTKTAVVGQMKEQCLPPDSTYLGTGRLGYGNPNSMEVDAWIGAEHQTIPVPMDVGFQILVTPDSCIPVVETGSGVSSGTSVVFTAEYFNVSPTIKDPDVFTPPSYCKSATVIPWEVAKMNPMVASFTKRFHKD